MDKKLFIQALLKFFAGVVIIGLLIFLPAGSLSYWQGWLLMGILFIPMFVAGLVMMAKNQELLRKRLNAKEEENEQKMVVKLSGLLFMAAFIVAGLNWRFGWCVLPDWAVWVSAAVFLACYLLYAEVLRENTYLYVPSKFKRIRRLSTLGYMESSGIRCIRPLRSCSWLCRWFWPLLSLLPSCFCTFPSSLSVSRMRRKYWRKGCRVTGSTRPA